MKSKIFIAALIGAGFVLGAVNSSAQNDTPVPGKKFVRRNEIAKAPEKYRAMANPFEHDSAAPAAGKFLYEQHCAECHGKTVDGTRRAPSLLRDRVQTAPSGSVFWLITNGVVWHGMPVWSKLPEPERWQIVSYIKSLGPTTGGHSQASIVAPR